MNLVCGKNSVLALLEQSPQRVQKLLVAEGLKSDERIRAILDRARASKLNLQRVPRQKLHQLVADKHINHQGVVAIVAPKPLLRIEDLVKKADALRKTGHQPLVLVLDGITDGRNFGAILRTADAAGVDGLVISKKDSAAFGPAVTKTASGAEETVDVAQVTNLTQALSKLKDHGFWIAGAAAGEDAMPYWQLDAGIPLVLVMGSEGKGISRLVQEQCDFLVRIPMTGAVESLNVSVAAGILLYDIIRKRTQ